MVKESISLHGNEEAERMQQGTRTRCNTQGHIPSDPARTHLLKFPAPSKIVLLDEDLGFKTWTYGDISFLNHSIAIKIYICFTINAILPCYKECFVAKTCLPRFTLVSTLFMALLINFSLDILRYFYNITKIVLWLKLSQFDNYS
jgi:hypothetical protein